MKEDILTTENYLFFLQLSEEVPDYFYDLSEHFSKWNIFLLPVTPKNLTELARGKVSDILVVTHNFSTQRNFSKVRKLYLDFGLTNRRFRLFHLSSFSQISIAHRFSKLNLYQYFQLPVSKEKISKYISASIYQEKQLEKKWPGGKRAKLPEQRR